jgi:zinc D-Ala-D-Ala carboxypeptidase
VTFYKHHRDVVKWQWRFFLPEDIACKGTGELVVDAPSLDKLDKLMEHLGVFKINSAYRSALHNARVGGAPLSQHRLGRAFDLKCAGEAQNILIDAAREIGFNGFGKYRTFVHIDTGPTRRWNQ